MIVSTLDHPPKTIHELVDPALARAFDRLDMGSRRVFAGKMQGERRSKRRGQSVEFDDFRTYSPGDDLRHIDWNVFARFDRLVLKLFRADEDLSVRVVLDASASMQAGEPSKLLTGARIAMGVGYIGLVNNNRVSLSVIGADGLKGLAPVRGRRNVERLARSLLGVLGSPPGDARTIDWNAAVRRIAGDRGAGQGVVVLISDFLVREGAQRGLDALASARGFDTACIQILSPDEIDPSRAHERGLVGDLRLTDIEDGRGAEVTISGALLRRYQLRLDALLGELARDTAARGMSCTLVRSDADIGELMLGTLRRGGLFRT